MTVLAILSSEAERTLMREIATRHGWHLTLAEEFIRSEAGVILYDRDSPGPGWRRALQSISSACPASVILLISSVTDEYLWREVVHLGGYDVLTRPLDASAVVHKVNLAWAFCRHKTTK
jgi:AmiR/NasT family two-component response regulator